MEEYLNKGVKEIITEFPEVGEILDEYNIGCVACSVGSCPLNEIVTIHNLSEEADKELMYKIEKAIYPDRNIKVSVLERKKKVPISQEDKLFSSDEETGRGAQIDKKVDKSYTKTFREPEP